MIAFIFNNLSLFLSTHEHLLVGENEKALLSKVNSDYINYKHIDFYAINAEQQINNKLQTIENYINEINQLTNRLQKNNHTHDETHTFIDKLSRALVSLEKKKIQLTRLKTKIPEGMLDIKRALYISEQSLLSYSQEENNTLKNMMVVLKEFMLTANKKYNRTIKEGGNLNFILFATTILYWNTLNENRKIVNAALDYVNKCTELTSSGKLVQRCITNASQKSPNQNTIEKALDLLCQTNRQKPHKNHLLNQVGFSSLEGRRICHHFKKSDKSFFHMPHNDYMYHLDYDPQLDLAETGGNCFGEALMFIHALSIGRFKLLCPEAGIINYQLDQTRKHPFKKILLGQAQTDVSDLSPYKTLQWENAKELILGNPNFIPGDLCAIFLTMNEYTRSKRSFTAGHLAVIAQLDLTQSAYKYVVFEKEIGVFGLVDDESLEYIVKEHIITMYEGMNYSNIELTKYADATPATYQFINQINPIIENLSTVQKNQIATTPNTPSFFQPTRPPCAPDINILTLSK